MESRIQANSALIKSGDILRVTTWNSLTAQSLTVSGRFADGSDFSSTLNPTSDRLASIANIALGEKVPISVVVSTAVATQRGQTFVRIAIVDSAGTQRAVLAQDYVTVAAPLAWPGGRISSPTEGPGAIRNITGTDPAPGAQSVEVVPTNARWRLLAWRATLTTDATAVTRNNPTLLFDDGANLFWVWFTPETVPASAIRRYNFAIIGVEHPNRSGEFGQPLPDLSLRANYRIRTSVGSFQTGDDWSAPQMVVEEWIDV